MVGFGTYKFKYLNTGKITPEEYFINAYKEELFESEQVHNFTKRWRTLVYAKHKKAYLSKLIKINHSTNTKTTQWIT